MCSNSTIKKLRQYFARKFLEELIDLSLFSFSLKKRQLRVNFKSVKSEEWQFIGWNIWELTRCLEQIG